MSAEGGTRAVVAALTANIFIAVTKFAAWGLTGASSMLAEAIHSVADSGNQILLLVGGRRAQRAATPEHPFGYGRERYVFGFIVAVVLFSVGGLFALYEAYHKYHEVHAGEPNLLLDGRWWWVPIVVLTVAIIAETFPSEPRSGNPTRCAAGRVAAVHPLGQGPRVAGDLARGLRGSAWPGLRFVRGGDDFAHP